MLSNSNYVKTLLLLMLFAILGLTGCASGPSQAELDKKEVEELYTEARDNLKSGNYTDAIAIYEKLEARFPYGKYAERAQMEIAFAYYKDSEPESAILAAERFIKLHPNHPNVDYLYYLRGLASYDLNESFFQRFFEQELSERDPKAARRAFEYFSQLVKKFPKSRYVKDALARMQHIRNSLAKYEVHVAKYYMKRGAYLAAANRGKYIVENYQQTPVIADALALMVDAYTQLGMKDLANDTYRVLKLNHPEHSSLTGKK